MKAVVVLVCLALAGCGWTKKSGRGTNVDPKEWESSDYTPNKRL